MGKRLSPTPDESSGGNANKVEEPTRFSANDPNMIIRGQPATAVYINPFDQVVIIQEAHDYGDDEPFVTFDRHHLPALIAKLKEYV